MFEIRTTPDGTVHLLGRLDASQSDAAMEALSQLAGPVVLDCAGLDYISSAGLGALIETFKRLRLRGHTLRLSNVTPRVKSVFKLANLDTLLGIE